MRIALPLVALVPSLGFADPRASWVNDCEALLRASAKGAWARGHIEHEADEPGSVSYVFDKDGSAYHAIAGPADPTKPAAPSAWSDAKDDASDPGIWIWRGARGRVASVMTLAPDKSARAFVAAFRPVLDRCLALPDKEAR